MTRWPENSYTIPERIDSDAPVVNGERYIGCRRCFNCGAIVPVSQSRVSHQNTTSYDGSPFKTKRVATRIYYCRQCA